MSSYLSGLFSLDGRTALVAGGAGAIGSAVSEALARAGATVIVHDLSQERLDHLAGEFRAKGLSFTGLQADLGTAEAAVGRDLQYIRINGTLVGGLVGVAIHALDSL